MKIKIRNCDRSAVGGKFLFTASFKADGWREKWSNERRIWAKDMNDAFKVARELGPEIEVREFK